MSLAGIQAFWRPWTPAGSTRGVTLFPLFMGKTCRDDEPPVPMDAVFMPYT